MKINRVHIVLLAFLLTACATQKPVSKNVPVDTNPLAVKNERLEQQLFIDGCRFVMLGDLDKAIAAFQEILRLNPNNDVAHYQLAGVYTARQQNEKALSHILPAISINDSNKWYRLLAAEIYESQKNYSAAAEQLRQLSISFPNDANYLFDYAFMLTLNNENEKAIETYNRIEKQAGITEEVSNAKKNLWLKLNKPEKAIDEIKRLRDAYPDEPAYQAMLIDLYSAQGMNDKAMDAIQGLAAVDSNNTQAQLALAEHHLKSGNWDKAYDALKVVFADSRINIDFKVKILLGYFPAMQSSTHRRNEAIDLAKILTKTHPSDAKSFALLGDVLSQDNRSREALSSYRQALKLDIGKFSVWQQILFLEASLKEIDSLIESATEVIGLFPDQPLAHYFMGVAYAQKQNCVSAIKSFQKVLAMATDDTGLLSQVHASIADCQQSLEQFDLAEASYEQSIALDSLNIYALNNYAYHLAVRGTKLEKAERLSSRVVTELAPDVANYMDTYAWVLYKQGRYSEARRWIESALSKTKTANATLLEHYGDILYKLNLTPEAVVEWKKALQAGGESDILERKIRDKQLYE